MDDVDIYGDLLDPPKPKAAAAAPPKPAQTAADPRQAPAAVPGGAPAEWPERPFRPRARNLVWKAPGVETPVTNKEAPAQPQKLPEKAECEVVEVLDDPEPSQPSQPSQLQPSKPSEPSEPSEPAEPATPVCKEPAPTMAAEAVPERKRQDVETLLKELRGEEAAPVAPGSPVSQEGVDVDVAMEDGGMISDGTEGSEEGQIHLGEVRASETGAAVPHFRRGQERTEAAGASGGAAPSGPRINKKEILLFIGPPPPLPPLAESAESSALLIGGLPWWLTDTELRRHGENFGQVRRLRILDTLGSGKSAGVALLEYVQVDAARKALRPDGLCRPELWRGLGAAPRAAAVGGELRGRLREGLVPWLDGGPCGEALRGMMLKQCGLSAAPAPQRSQRRSPRRSPPKRHSRPQAPPKRAEREPDNPSSWAEKLKKLKSNVNSRLDSK